MSNQSYSHLQCQNIINYVWIKPDNNIELDPWHRKVQFPKEKLIPFDRWYTAELKRQKKANTPNKKARENFDEKVFRLGDHVFIDWDQNAVGMVFLLIK